MALARRRATTRRYGMLWPWDWGFGCGPTQAPVDKLKQAQANKAGRPTDYGFTIITDHGDYEIDRVNDPNGKIILNVDREFLTLQVSKDSFDEQSEKVYVRLCSIRAIQEHFNRT
jgi:hypothetical protein